MSNLLEIRTLKKSYDDFTLHLKSLVVPAGGVIGLIGSNGAGKTTTIKAALGLIFPDEGSVALFGKEVITSQQNQADAALAKAKERIGIVFDSCPFPPDMRVGDVGVLGKCLYSAWDKAQFASLLEHFGLDPKKTVDGLSRGMGMKLQLAFAFAHQPELLILDEATAGLDPLARQEILDFLRDFMQDERHGILLSSHITTDLERIADEVVCVDEGKVVFEKTIDEVCDLAGVARCKNQEARDVLASGVFSGKLRVMRHDYSVDILVPDRTAFAKAFPQLACERVSLDTYMLFMLKGELS